MVLAVASQKALAAQVAEADVFQSAARTWGNRCGCPRCKDIWSRELDEVRVSLASVSIMARVAGGSRFHDVQAVFCETLIGENTGTCMAIIAEGILVFTFRKVILHVVMFEENRLVNRAMRPAWSCRIVIIVTIRAAYQALFSERPNKTGNVHVCAPPFNRMIRWIAKSKVTLGISRLCERGRERAFTMTLITERVLKLCSVIRASLPGNTSSGQGIGFLLGPVSLMTIDAFGMPLEVGDWDRSVLARVVSPRDFNRMVRRLSELLRNIRHRRLHSESVCLFGRLCFGPSTMALVTKSLFLGGKHRRATLAVPHMTASTTLYHRGLVPVRALSKVKRTY